jgi:hypothetical protein
METKRFSKQKGVKPQLLSLKVGETISFPRPRISSVRTTLSVLRVEYPEKEFDYNILEKEISVILLNEKRDSTPAK